MRSGRPGAGAAVVAPLLGPPAPHVGLAAHPRAAGAVEQLGEEVHPAAPLRPTVERRRLRPPARKVGLRGGDDRRVGALADVLAAAVDGLAEIQVGAPQDVLDRLLDPRAPAAVQALGPELLRQPALGDVAGAVAVEDAAHELGLGGTTSRRCGWTTRPRPSRAAR